METPCVSPKPPTPAELIRLRIGYRRPAIAKRAGICRKTLERVERGLNWSQPSTVERIAEALGVDPEVYFLAVFQSWRQEQAVKRAA
jgi:transcriptional regulator with XRE-family HTH domain